MALSCIIAEIKRDIGRKTSIYFTPLAFDAPIRGIPGVILSYSLVRENVWLPDSEQEAQLVLG